MSDLLKNMIAARATAWEEGKRLLDAADAEKRELTAEESQSWERITADLDAKDKRIAELGDLAEREKRAAELAEQYPSVAQPVEEREAKPDTDVIRRMAAGELRSFDFTSEKRDLTKGTATAGGNTVPTGFYGQLVEHMVAASAIRQTNVTVLTTDSGQDIQIPKTTAFSSAAIIGEGSTVTESDPAFGQVTLGAFKYGFSVQISSELEQDTGVDLAGFLAAQGGAALGRGSGADFIKGAGTTSAPQGVVGVATTGVTGATSVSGAFTADNLIDLYFSVIAPYRANASWLMSDTAVAAARKLKETTTGQYLWQPGLVSGEPNMMLGRPLYADPNVDAPGTSKKSVVFGDLSKYFIRDVAGVRVERSVDFAFQNDLVTWRFILRTDGDLVDTTGAVKVFVGGAS